MSKILVVAPHPDDEVLGVGGTIAKRCRCGDQVYVCIVTKGQQPMFSKESVAQVRSEAVAAHQMLGVAETIFLDLPAVLLDTLPQAEVNAKIGELVSRILPDEVYIPHFGDIHKDHFIVAEACMVALRPKYQHKVSKIYAYETLSETGWHIPNATNQFTPTVYEDITDTLQDKLSAMSIFKSQVSEFPDARSVGALEALAKYRGSAVGVEAAEAFCLIREIK